MNSKVKKSACMLILFAVSIAASFGADADSRVPKPVQVPVIVYHHVVENQFRMFMPGSIVTSDKLEADMKRLKEHGYNPIFFSDLHGYLRYGKPLPRNPIIITFDDGYLSNYKIAYPIMKEHGMKADIFIIGWCVGIEKVTQESGVRIPHFGWKAAYEMEKSGHIEIESHTYDLHNLEGYSWKTNKSYGMGIMKYRGENAARYIARISADFKKSADGISVNLGSRPLAISYPFGVSSAEGRSVVKSFYSGSFTIKPGIRTFRRASDLYDIPRILVRQNTDVIEAIDKECRLNLIFPWIF